MSEDYFISNKQQALSRVTEIDAEIKTLRQEQERLAAEYELVIRRGGYGSGETFYPTLQAMCEENDWTESEAKEYTGYSAKSFPRWISSSENC